MLRTLKLLYVSEWGAAAHTAGSVLEIRIAVVSSAILGLQSFIFVFNLTL